MKKSKLTPKFKIKTPNFDKIVGLHVYYVERIQNFFDEKKTSEINFTEPIPFNITDMDGTDKIILITSHDEVIITDEFSNDSRLNLMDLPIYELSLICDYLEDEKTIKYE